MSKTNPSPSYRLRLRLLAAQNDTNNLSDKDRKLVSDLLRHLANGATTEDFFGANNPAHRPTSPAVDQRIFEVCLAMAPREMGGEELNKTQAINSVAKIHKIDDERIIENLKSSRGKKLYDRFTSAFSKNPQGD